MRLVKAWLAYRAEQGEGAAACARYLNARLGKQYTSARIWEWEHGKRPVPEEVARVMREEILPWLMDREDFVDPSVRNRIASILEILL